MALSTRELLLVLRARDEASRVLNGLGRGFGDVDSAAAKAAKNQTAAGAALVGLGVGIAGAGVAVLDWMAGTVKDAANFEQQVARVATQTDKVKTSQEELGRVVKTVAKDVAVPIEELSNGLYDIFSSMDVTVPQAQTLLEAFAKEAVAGQVSIQDASRATIGIMNSFHIPVSKVNDVLDVQFQLVRKGVGTFQEFSTAIGKATPSATRAGQSVQQLAGMMAFMTRNGMTAAQAGTSAARAFDALANPKVVGRLEAMGVKVRDANGDFRGMSDIMQDLQKKLSGLTDPQRAAELQKLFLGAGGTIQARRFYDMVLKDQGAAKQFVGLVGDMNNASGAFTDAYGTMAGTAASKTQVLQNQWELVRIEVGQALMPILTELLKVLSAVLGWWNNLGEGTKKTIIWIVAAGAALAVVVGALIAVAGVIMMVSGAAAALGIGVGALIGIFAAVVAGIAAIVAIGYLVVKNWDWIKSTAEKVWQGVVDVFNAVVEWIKANFGDKLSAIWDDMSSKTIEAFNTVRDWIVKIWNDIVDWTSKLWNKIKPIIMPIVEWLIGIWDNVKNILKDVLDILISAFKFAWDWICAVLKGAWEIISGVIEGIWNVIKGLVDLVVGVLTGDWSLAWEGIKEIFSGIWMAIEGIIVGAFDMIMGTIDAAMQFVLDIIEPAWDIIKNLFQVGVETVYNFWLWIWGMITNIVEKPIKAVVDAVKWLVDKVSEGFRWMRDRSLEAANWIGDRLNDIGRFFRDLPGKILDAVKGFATMLWQNGRDLVQGLINGIGDMARAVANKLLDIARNAWQGVKDFFGFGSPSRLARQGGQWVGQSLALGFGDMTSHVASAAQRMADAANPKLGGLQSAAKEALAQLSKLKGGGLHEDFSFKGMSDNLGMFNDQIAKQYYATGKKFNQGSMIGYLQSLVNAKSGTFGIGPFGVPSGSAPQVNQSIGIYTTQLDPQRNAADLGFALANGVIG